MWRNVGKACELKHSRAPTVRLLFPDERATSAISQLLRDTTVGRMVTLVTRGDGEEWVGLEEVKLWPEGEG